MNQLKPNKIGFSNELHNELQNNFLSENHFRTQEQTKSKQNEEYSFTDLHSQRKVYDTFTSVAKHGNTTYSALADAKQEKDKVSMLLYSNDKDKLSFQNDNKLLKENCEHFKEPNLEQQKKLIKRQKYNTYMKSYRERKKKEIEDRIKSIDISLNEQTKSYNKDDIKEALFDCINTLINIININLDKFTNEAKNDIIKCQYSGDILQYTNTLTAYLDLNNSLANSFIFNST
ncbi:hypothetical protein M9Y10_034963 [Tritrichomonas musculus]|uniref:Uncharacterized protein n=1 Tax=Tritrichomonas musculus TaxID=1915356 RepID=A0ABR2KHA8_9EUKA